MRKVWWGLGALGVLLIAAAGAFCVWLRAIAPPLSGTERLSGLGAPVTVLWDSLAVPHVIAASDSDLFAAIGYLHARDRLFQMDLLRHAAEGRLSELFGRRTVAADRSLRTLEMATIAVRRYAAAGPESQRVTRAYARGVNAWIARHDRAPEFRLLGHEPEPWLPVHSIEVGVLESWDLRSDGDELQLAALGTRLGDSTARLLDPQYPATGPVIVGATGAARGSPPPASMVRGIPALLDDREDGARGSNAWVIGPAHTASGRPIVANDPHLTLRAPAIWYLVGAHAPGYEVVGATIPGVPEVILGHNAHVAWGFTNGTVDDVDYVVEQLNADSTQVRTAGGWAPVEAVAETIRVKGGAPVAYVRRRTGHGPVVERAWHGASAGQVLVLRWVAQDTGSDELSALLGMGRAAGYDQFAAAVAGFRTPEQNIVYGDETGTIAYFLAGHVPVRRHGDGGRPTAGWSDDGRWERYLTTRELPSVRDPAAGWIVTANNKIAGDGYPFFLARVWEAPYRAQRIIEMLQATPRATAATEAGHQVDQVDTFLRGVLPLARSAASAAGRDDIARRLEGWDGTMRADSVQPTIVWSWYRQLQWLAYQDASPDYRPASPLHAWLRQGRTPWSDVPTLATAAMRALPPRLDRTPWGSVHHTVIEHPLGAIPVLGRLGGFTVGPLAGGGGNYTVDVASTSERMPPYVNHDGPSLRHVVDLGDVDGAGGFILPTGQSGYPRSRHYRDMTERWRRGELWRLPVDARRVVAPDTLRLLPQP